MVTLNCRQCGTEISSSTKQTKCAKCGTLFPFACAVCGKLLKPPIPDFPVERYFTDDKKPLCQEHYQRQCPECQRWFQADENPGYFLCRACTEGRGSEGASSSGRTSLLSRFGCGGRAAALIVFLCPLIVAGNWCWSRLAG